MGTNLAPTPTEYAGVTFRSKSEAIFARVLDLSSWVHAWEYEPAFEPRHRIPNGHVWDFAVLHIDCETAFDEVHIIEYKPSQPTAAYVQHLINDYKKRGCSGYTALPFMTFGNPFNESRMSASYVCQNGALISHTRPSDHTYNSVLLWPIQDVYWYPNSDRCVSYERYDTVSGFGLDIEDDVINEAMTYRFDLLDLYSISKYKRNLLVTRQYEED